jgi:hypothetical protein
LRAFLKTEPETHLANARGRRSIWSGGFLRRQPGQSPWVRAVCTNEGPLWKGPRAIFSGFYGGPNGHYRAALARKSAKGQRWASKQAGNRPPNNFGLINAPER